MGNDPWSAVKMASDMNKLHHPERQHRPYPVEYQGKLYITNPDTPGAEPFGLTKKQWFVVLHSIQDYVHGKK